MKLEQISLPVNNVVLADYWEKEANIHSFFTYPFEQQSFAKRASVLQKQFYKREALAEIGRAHV